MRARVLVSALLCVWREPHCAHTRIRDWLEHEQIANGISILRAIEAAKGVDSTGLWMLSREFFERAFESGEECFVGCFIRSFLAGGRHLARA